MTRERLIDHKLRDGWVRLEREVKDGEALLHFAVELNTRFPAQIIFDQLLQAIADSSKSWLWPNQYESTPAAQPEALHEGGVFRMTYRVPRFDKPEKAPVPVTYAYSLPQFRPEERRFEYRSVDHPLKGGAVVKVVPLDASRSRISWIGAYRQDPSQAIVVRSMVSYIPFLYGVFEDNLEAREKALASGGT